MGGINKTEMYGDRPPIGHVVFVSGEQEGIALVPGTQFIIVPDPDRTDRDDPVFLVEVKRDEFVFRCNCREPRCTRVLRYKLHVTGNHHGR